VNWWLWFSGLLAFAIHAQDLKVPLVDPGTGTLYVQGRLGHGLSTPMLVDTGSSYSTLSQALLLRLQQEDGNNVIYVGSRQGILADGKKITVPLYRVRQLRIGERCLLNDMEMAVFPQSRRAILGLNVLTRLSPFSISVDPPSITLSGCGTETAIIPGQQEPSLAAAP